MEFFYFFGDGVGMSVNRGGRGVSRSGEVNPSAEGSGTWLPRHGGMLCFYALTSSANADIYQHIYLLSRSYSFY